MVPCVLVVLVARISISVPDDKPQYSIWSLKIRKSLKEKTAVREEHREITSEICRSLLSLQLSHNEHIPVRKPLRVGKEPLKRIRGKILGSHTGPRIACVPTSQRGRVLEFMVRQVEWRGDSGTKLALK